MSGWKSGKSPSQRWKNRERVQITRRKGTATIRKQAGQNLIYLDADKLPKTREGFLGIATSRGTSSVGTLFLATHELHSSICDVLLLAGAPPDQLRGPEAGVEVCAALHRIKKQTAKVMANLRSLDASHEENEAVATQLIVFKARLLRKRTTNIEKTEGLGDKEPVDELAVDIRELVASLCEATMLLFSSARSNDKGARRERVHHERYMRLLSCKVKLADAVERILDFCQCCGADVPSGSVPHASTVPALRTLLPSKQTLCHVPAGQLELFSSYDYQFSLLFAEAKVLQRDIHELLTRPHAMVSELRRKGVLPTRVVNGQRSQAANVASISRRLALRREALGQQSCLLADIAELSRSASRLHRATSAFLASALPRECPLYQELFGNTSYSVPALDTSSDEALRASPLYDQLYTIGTDYMHQLVEVAKRVTAMREEDTKDYVAKRNIERISTRYEEDVVQRNIWREPTREGQNVVYVEDDATLAGLPRIKAATVNQLVLRLTNESHHDIEFLKAFITTFRSFTTPDVLFEKLIQRYEVPLWTKGKLPTEEWMTTIVMPIRIRVISVITMWLRSRFSDFDYFLAMKLSKFCDKLIEDGHPKLATQVSRCLSRCAGLAQSQLMKRRISIARSGSVHSIINSGEWLLDMDPDVVAQHIAMREFELYRAIQPVELLNQAWNKPKYRHRSPNVCEVIKNFNKMAGWVVVSVMNQRGLRQRARLLTKFMQICTALFDMNDFNGANSLLAGCNNHCLARLRHTLDEVPTKAKEGLQRVSKIIVGEKSPAYTNLLNSVAPPVLPYLGYYLSELTFLEESSSDEVNSLINFTKRERIYSVISEIHKWQQTAYQFEQSVSVRSLLDAIRVDDDEEQWWEMSMKLEPRDVPKSQLEL